MQFWILSSIFSWHWLLALLGLLFGSLSGLSLATWSGLRLWKANPDLRVNVSAIWSEIWNMARVMAVQGRKAAAALGLVALGIILGAAGDQLWTFHHYETLADVYVLEKIDDQHFRMQTDKGQAFQVTMCDDSKVDWRAGERLKVFNYEQRRGCKSVVGKNLGYIEGE